MAIDMARSIWGWCTAINIGLLIWWSLLFSVAHAWVYRFHGKLFKISVEAFDSIHYAGMAIFKIGVLLFNLVPYLALLIVGQVS